jgi:hypothetical protein
MRPTHSPVSLRHNRDTPVHLRGPVTGHLYEFPGAGQTREAETREVDQRDAAALLRTGLFSRA